MRRFTVGPVFTRIIIPSLLLLRLLAPAGSSALSGRQQPLCDPLDQELIEARISMAKPKTSQRLEILVKLFEEAGCRGNDLVRQKVDGTRYPNVVCTLRGQTDRLIIVGAHYDMAEIGSGVADNWSGAALLPSLYQSLCRSPSSHTFVFVGFSAEERGLIGSKFFVKQLNNEAISRTRAMINLDTLGLSHTRVEYGRSDPELLQLLGRVARSMELPLSGVDAHLVGTSDFKSFMDRKIPVLSIHSLTQDTLHIIHSVRDNLKAIRMEDYYATYRLLCSFLHVLDNQVSR